MAYNSKYTGEQVEALLDKAAGAVGAFEVEDVRYGYDGVTTRAAMGRRATIDIYDTLDRVCYNVESVSSDVSVDLTVNLNGFASDGSITGTTTKEWMIVVDCTGDVPTVSWPSALKWAGGEVVTMEAGYVYEFHIVASSFGSHIVGQKFKAVSA